MPVLQRFSTPLDQWVRNGIWVLNRIQPIPSDWVDGVSTPKGPDGENLTPLPCDSYRQLVEAWKQALYWTDGLDCALSVMLASAMSTNLVGEQLWVKVQGPPGCGKTTLLEGLAVSTKYVLSKDSIRGFHAGWRSENGEDVSLIQLARGKTLATKDGDTLLKAPNRAQILSEARAIYDRNSRTHYRNSVANDYVGYRMTWILCGTAALREIDDSELGARFIDCVVMDSIDDDLEDEIALMAGQQENEGMRAATNCSPTTHYSEALATAMRLTGGYVEYLRKNDERLMESVQTSDYAIRKCTRYGKFIALMRARPSADEEATREFCPRLVKQMVRLTNALCVVLNKSGPDREVMRRVKKVALDTSRGPILDICRFLYKNINGLEKRGILIYTGFEDNYLTSLLKFMKKIKIIEPVPIQPGEPKRNLRWRLTERTRKLYHAVYTHDEDA